MEFLDAIIAVALTLAALATVVTILLEIFIRVAGLKARGQVALFGRLFDDVLSRQMPDGAVKWEIVKAVLESRGTDRKMAASEKDQRYFGTAAGPIYDGVSLEHFLRRLLETSPAAALVAETEEALKAKLGLIARKYEEYCSALGADFKRNALRWSVWTGIVLAFAMNADGLRLFSTYMGDSALRERAIERLAESEMTEPASVAGSEGAGDVLAGVRAARGQLELIDAAALPLGASYFPYCHVPWLHGGETASPDPLCQNPEAASPVAGLLWLLKVLATGILIGLGAPFWYDVAKRLSEVRSAFGGKAPTAVAHRGADAKGDHDRREALVAQIVADVKAVAAATTPGARP